MPFPLIKLGYLAIKQVSKPLANAIKHKAKTTPFLRNYVLLPPAQFYHKMETVIKMRLLGLGKVSEVKPLSEAMAVDLAADMLGEGVIFGLASGTLYLEYRRQQRKDQNKEDTQNRRLRELEREVAELALIVHEDNIRLQEAMRRYNGEVGAEGRKTGDLPTQLVDPKSKVVLQVSLKGKT